MMRKRTGHAGARALAVLAAAPLLGVVPLAGAAARADGPGPSGHKGQHGHQGKGHEGEHGHKGKGKGQGHKGKGKGKGRARPAPHRKPVKQQKKARSVRLHTSGPGQAVLPGRTYDWPFAVTANGPGKAGRAVVRATLPKSLEFVSGRRDCAVSGWTVECDLGAVRPGETVAGMIRAKVARRARPDEALRIPATATWRGMRAAASFPAVRVARTADLVMQKTAPATARAGAPISYQLKIGNRGPATAENVFVHASGPVRLLVGNAACVPERRGFVCGVGSLRPGETRTLRFKVLPAGNVRAGKVLQYASRVTSSTIDPRPGNNSATVRTRMTAQKSPVKKSPVKKGHAEQAGGKKHAPKGTPKHAPKKAPKKAQAGAPQSKRAAGR
ncbi:hypothetical protein amrb99_49100 [Actinomadura sp. RB99]|uniref:DUF11 domain-containing protein n=1 Tax=Actinomadura sp. RB99 TaxID=2691577 RepID=UPI001682EB0D|nr:DUF11 domain-containing protein [Actinomadura sp. RB99]MBD2895968.1 hypothetical protein [Actinomadura sp. RB99]